MNEKTHYVSPLPGFLIDTLQTDNANHGKFDDAIAYVDDILKVTIAIGYESTVVATGEGS